jgi:hypothetical protein
VAGGQHPEIWGCEKIASAFKLLEATSSCSTTETAGSMDTRTMGRALLDKVKCVKNLLDNEEHPPPAPIPVPVTDYSDLVFEPAPPPIPSSRELIYWYANSRCKLTRSFMLCLRILVLRWAATGVSDGLDLEAWITTLMTFMEVYSYIYQF